MNEQKEQPKMITQTTVREMGFTQTMIDKLLPEPVLKTNPHYKCASPMKLWEESVVISVMETDEYKEMRKKMTKRQASAEKAVQTKKDKAEKILESFLESIVIERMDMDELQEETLAAKQYWYEINGRWDYIYDNNAYDADGETIQRWMVNYIRHNLCSYENGLDAIFGKTGKGFLYNRLKKTILLKIAETYPELEYECSKQLRSCY